MSSELLSPRQKLQVWKKEKAKIKTAALSSYMILYNQQHVDLKGFKHSILP